FAPKPTAQRNFTDPESKIMKTSDGAYHQCFNGQAVVDSVAQVIVCAELSDEAPDARQLDPALAQLAANLKAIDAELPAGAALLGGNPAARAQWRFHCAVHNLLKLHRNGGLALIPAG